MSSKEETNVGSEPISDNSDLLPESVNQDGEDHTSNDIEKIPSEAPTFEIEEEKKASLSNTPELTSTSIESHVESKLEGSESIEICQQSLEPSSPVHKTSSSGALAGGDSSSIPTQNDEVIEPHLIKNELLKNSNLHGTDDDQNIEGKLPHSEKIPVQDESSLNGASNLTEQTIPKGIVPSELSSKAIDTPVVENEPAVENVPLNEQKYDAKESPTPKAEESLLKLDTTYDVKDEDFTSMPSLEKISRKVPETPKRFEMGESPRHTDEDGWLDLTGGGGLKKKVIKTGHGYETRPHKGDIVTISYQCFFMDGVLMEEKSNLEVILGDWDVIPGVDMALALMEEGEKSELLVPRRFACAENFDEEGNPENPFYKYALHLVAVERESEENFASIERSRKFINAKRERGNKLYSEDCFSTALIYYERILNFIQRISKKSTDKDLNEIEEAFNKELDSLRNAMLNNKAACQLKLQLWDLCLQSLEEVLEKDPKNIKALFRKAKVLEYKGNYDEAINFLKYASTMEPGEKIFKQVLAEVQAKKKVQSLSEKEMYQRMFNSKNTSPPKQDKKQNGVLKWGLVLGSVVALACSVLLYRHFNSTGTIN